jgi:hypothetical protein
MAVWCERSQDTFLIKSVGLNQQNENLTLTFVDNMNADNFTDILWGTNIL